MIKDASVLFGIIGRPSGCPFLCAGHEIMLMGLKSPAGRDERNREPKATATQRCVVGRKPQAKVGLDGQEPD